MPKSEKLKLIISYVNHVWKSRFAVIYVEYFLERFTQKSCDCKYCPSFTKFLKSEQLSLKPSKIYFINE